jgi:ankyrin repeat protein
VAARFGIANLAQTLLKEPTSDPNLTDSLNRTPLMLAAAHGHISVLRVLLECEEIDINLMDCNHRNALGAAVKYGQAESVEVLLSCPNVDVNLGTPLLDATDDYLTMDYQLSLSKKKISKLLLSRPDLDVNVVSSGIIPHSAWDIVARTGDFDTFQLLLGRSDFDPDHSNSVAREQSLERCVSDCCNYLFNSNVMCEEAVANIALILQMIDQDHRPRFPNDYYILRFTWPIIYYTFSGAFTANPSEICEVDSQYIWQNSPKYRPRLLELLKMCDFTPFIKDSEGRTYLHYTATGQKEEYVRYLLELGVDAAALDKAGLRLSSIL